MKNYKKTEHFEPIAMKANLYEIKELEKIFKEFHLPIYDTTLSCDFPYLINFYSDDNQLGIGTYSKDIAKELHETFNAETFLKACGIVSEPLYQLTAKEMRNAYENPQWLKDMFKECFETELEVGKWYKSDFPLFLFITEIRHHELVGYGFNAKEEYIEGTFCTRADVRNKVDYDNFNFRPATEKEVEEALVKESIKRGYKEGVKVLSLSHNKELTIKETDGKGIFEYYFTGDKIHYGLDSGYYVVIYEKGKWAEILNIYTINEAEEKFNIKIVEKNGN